MRKVSVVLAESSYDILIGEGVVHKLKDLIVTEHFSKTALIVSDNVVAKLYAPQIMKHIASAGLTAELFVIDAGEQSKCAAVAEKIYTKAISLGLDRKSPIFALGGGVVGDLTGFIAATYLRGVPFIQLPTSLLAQVDSSVGGKVAINHPLGKNLIGAFYQPKFVLIDLEMLQSLPERELYTGLAEIIKYGIIYDCDFFSYLEQNAAAILARHLPALKHIIARSCEIKAKIVSQDEKESGIRIILNFGHTIAHAIESDTGYEKYNHGEAVAIGMYGAALLSHYLGFIDQITVNRVATLIQTFHLPITAKECSIENMFNLLLRDKKVINGKIKWVCMGSIGCVHTSMQISDDLIHKVLQEIVQ